ncbi:endonuclease domain-containing protein [Halothiobacillus sp. DCM-1]|uniref:endonuclease domain-containing protein n=1 Tax=Halothiobacillus sp. DCM-1 TaxID=3112558 RepID=UPI00324B3C99
MTRSSLIQNARKLRAQMTDAERAIWRHLRGEQLGVKFRRQAPIGRYIVDFVCLSHKLVIEIDGGQHANNAEDRVRDAFLSTEGFKVLRFWNNEVLQQCDGVLETVRLALIDRESRR